MAEELTAEDVPKRRRADAGDEFDTRLGALEVRVTAIERTDARMGEMFRAVIATVDGLATVLTIIAPANTETTALLTKLVQSDTERTARETAIKDALDAQQVRQDRREDRMVRWARWLLSGFGAVATLMAAVIIGSLPAWLHIWFYPLFGVVLMTVVLITSYLYIWRRRA